MGPSCEIYTCQFPCGYHYVIIHTYVHTCMHAPLALYTYAVMPQLWLLCPSAPAAPSHASHASSHQAYPQPCGNPPLGAHGLTAGKVATQVCTPTSVRRLSFTSARVFLCHPGVAWPYCHGDGGCQVYWNSSKSSNVETVTWHTLQLHICTYVR